MTFYRRSVPRGQRAASAAADAGVQQQNTLNTGRSLTGRLVAGRSLTGPSRCTDTAD